jgi:hypothetical protein
MDQRVARRIAYANHLGQRTRFGDSVIDHLTHVVAAVAPQARAVAWLHDLLELTSLDTEHLRAQGLTRVQESALGLLTREPAAPYEQYIARIARAGGAAGRMARMVKLADLDDHLAHGWAPPGAPPYAWARRRVCEPRQLTPVGVD